MCNIACLHMHSSHVGTVPVYTVWLHIAESRPLLSLQCLLKMRQEVHKAETTRVCSEWAETTVCY